jgi:hypothetical protein
MWETLSQNKMMLPAQKRWPSNLRFSGENKSPLREEIFFKRVFSAGPIILAVYRQALI